MWSKVTSLLSSTSIVVEDVAPRFGILWEPNDDSWTCRACNIPFQAPITTRHHCRGCTICFCDACAPVREASSNSITRAAKAFIEDSSADGIRICDACLRGECPGRPLQTKVLESLMKPSNYSFRKGPQANDSSSGKPLVLNLAKTEKGAPRRFEFVRGELSNIDDPALNPPLSGHFEFKNKTDSVCAVKLLVARLDKNWALLETARPSFTAVAPGESIHCSFDPSEGKEDHLDLIVLHSNKNPIVKGGRLIADTRGHGVSTDTISPCASIPAFTSACAYKILTQNKNAIVKLRGPEGSVEVAARQGNSLERVGLIQRFVYGKKFCGNKLDFETNTGLVKPLFTVN